MDHDFNLHAPEGANKKKRKLGRGRGSGQGGTAGKGNKGQKSRSGGKTYVGFEGGQMPLYRRLAQRGFSNYPFKKSFQIVNLGEIDKRFNEGETVDEVSLFDKGLIKGRKRNDLFTVDYPVKILGNGDLTKKLKFKIGAASDSLSKRAAPTGCAVPAGCAVSGPAKVKIEKSGGEWVSHG
jgi:large subunit ribosomal protein L15